MFQVTSWRLCRLKAALHFTALQFVATCGMEVPAIAVVRSMSPDLTNCLGLFVVLQGYLICQPDYVADYANKLANNNENVSKLSLCSLGEQGVRAGISTLT